MSLIAASQDDIDEGKHAALADLYFLLTLDASLVDAAEKQASKNELLEGIKKHSALKSIKFIFFLFISFVNQFLPLLFSSLLFPCSSNIHFSPTTSDTFPFFFPTSSLPSLSLPACAEMSVFYQHCVDTLGWDLDATLLSSMQEDNAKELAEIEAKMIKAQEDEGETEIMDANIAKCDMMYRIGCKDEALAVIKEALVGKHVSTGQKIDLELKCIRIAMFHNDTELLKEHIELARALIEQGGDWDRRNRLKVFDGAYRMMVRDFTAAAKNFMSSIATFTSYEVMEYKTFIQRTVYLSLYQLPRSEMKEKIIDSPDVRQVVREVADVKNFVESLYSCDYKAFFAELLTAQRTIW